MWINLKPSYVADAVGVPVLADDNSNLSDFFSVDTIGDKQFSLNYGGYPRSDIALINEMSDLRTAQSALQNLDTQVVPDVNVGKSDAEILLQHRSKYCQTAAESIRYHEAMIQLELDRQREKAVVEKPAVQFEKSDKDIIDNA